MKASIIHSTNPFQPAVGKKSFEVDTEISVSGWLEENPIDFSKPTICILNGEVIYAKNTKPPLFKIKM